jgi:hypothetical protein
MLAIFAWTGRNWPGPLSLYGPISLDSSSSANSRAITALVRSLRIACGWVNAPLVAKIRLHTQRNLGDLIAHLVGHNSRIDGNSHDCPGTT